MKIQAGYTLHTDYDPHLEAGILGICLNDPDAYSTLATLLREECFYIQHHRQVYTAIHKLWQDSYPIDLFAVSRALYDEGTTELDGQNTTYFLTQLRADVSNLAHAMHWAVKLRELAARRLMIELTSSGLRGEDDLHSTATRIQTALQGALDIRTNDDWMSATDAAHALTQHMDEVQGQPLIGISTTFPQIDNVNGGFRPGQLVVIGARPSVGKSALMGAIALEAATTGHNVGIISLEMSAADVFGRMLSYTTNVPFGEIDKSSMTDRTRNQVNNTLGQLSTLPIWFSQGTQANIHDIRTRATQLHRRHGLHLLIIDYLQLIEETNTHSRSREQGVSQISRGLKSMAMNMGIPIIALSQLNRESEHRKDKRPSMADLRESGAIEQDADIIMLLHRDWRCGVYYDALGNSTENQADLLIPKWRNGSPFDLKLHFNPTTMRFSEWKE